MKLNLKFQLIKNMGLRYVGYQIFGLVKNKIGYNKIKFPINPEIKSFISLEQWKSNLPPFFFYGKEINGLEKTKIPVLKNEIKDIKKGVYTFFSKTKLDLGTNYDWITNPITKHKYNITKHWSQIQDLSKEAGDIKYVWEKARFTFLYDIIRYDYHYEEDQSEFVFSEIESFIDKNPINQGPNYICSQETSLRILNWTFALYYYKDSTYLTEEFFQKLMNSIYHQLQHVYANINFSRIAVRNNHAITETLMLYLSNKFFPFIKETKKWSKKGKQWFEQEIEYQIYKDGTFLQFSMNYHRVVIQLLTLGIQIAKLNNETFKNIVYQRAQKSLDFLDSCSDPITGKLPNYGANDGALFFKFNNDDYRNYRSQLDDLRLVLNGNRYYKSESSFWYGFEKSVIIKYKYPSEINSYKNGGYYILQENNTKTFIKCGAYKDRPSQSDNLHLDIWIDGINYLRDSGSYRYNASKEVLNYFNGCEGHNTVSIEKENQMLKGSRFIWYYWVKKATANWQKKVKYFEFNGNILAFRQLGKNINHYRKVKKYIDINIWEIEDRITNKKDKKIYQYWHIHPNYIDKIKISVTDDQEQQLEPLIEEKWFSGYYGIKEKSIRYTFKTKGNKFNTKIKITT